MDDKRKQELEKLAGGLNAGALGALEAAGSLTDEEREFVSAAMRDQTAPPADPVGTVGIRGPRRRTADPDATGGE